ncbi:MAG: hypothetical protein KF753_25150 [Caldilineaceae bacterium]|nr:hypothetical protein [Caldilineaceae bacterium]
MEKSISFVILILVMFGCISGKVQAQEGSQLPILDNILGTVLVDIYKNTPNGYVLVYENVPMEEYIKNTLPNEWVAGYDDYDALKAGAVAIRTYALNNIHRGVLLLATEGSQVYIPGSEHIRSTFATALTNGIYMAMPYNVCVDSNAPIDARYAQETGNPTANYTSYPFPHYPYLASAPDAHTATVTQLPGMCQLGSEWYASTQGWLYETILDNYYSGTWTYRTIKTGEGGCIIGDVNCDCAVNIQDLSIIGSRFGSTSATSGWDPRYNIVLAGSSVCEINIQDLSLIGSYFGQTCQY